MAVRRHRVRNSNLAAASRVVSQETLECVVRILTTRGLTNKNNPYAELGIRVILRSSG